MLKFAAAGAAVAAAATALVALSVAYPSNKLHGPELQIRHLIELALLLVAVGAASAWAGSRLNLRRSGLAGVAGLILAAMLLGFVRTGDVTVTSGTVLALVAAPMVAAMMVIATPSPPTSE